MTESPVAGTPVADSPAAGIPAAGSRTSGSTSARLAAGLLAGGSWLLIVYSWLLVDFDGSLSRAPVAGPVYCAALYAALAALPLLGAALPAALLSGGELSGRWRWFARLPAAVLFVAPAVAASALAADPYVLRSLDIRAGAFFGVGHCCWPPAPPR